MSATGSRFSFRQHLLGAVCMAALSLTLAGCASKGQLTTGSIPSMNKPLESMTAVELSSAADSFGKAYDRDPKNAAVGMKYASVLTMSGRAEQALAVMQQVAIHNPTDRTVLAAYGKALAGAGQLEQALDAIQRAQTPDRPDWQLLSAEGAVYDQLGNPAAARERYRKALDLKPNEPSVLSNLGMSYVLQGDLRTAETYLSSAAQQPAARQPRATESGPGGGPARPVPGSREDRRGGTVAEPGAGQRGLSSRHAFAAERLEQVAGQGPQVHQLKKGRYGVFDLPLNFHDP